MLHLQQVVNIAGWSCERTEPQRGEEKYVKAHVEG